MDISTVAGLGEPFGSAGRGRGLSSGTHRLVIKIFGPDAPFFLLAFIGTNGIGIDVNEEVRGTKISLLITFFRRIQITGNS